MVGWLESVDGYFVGWVSVVAGGGGRRKEDLILLGCLGHAGGLGAADASVAVAVGAGVTR